MKIHSQSFQYSHSVTSSEVPSVRSPCVVAFGKFDAHASLDAELRKLCGNSVVNLARHEFCRGVFAREDFVQVLVIVQRQDLACERSSQKTYKTSRNKKFLQNQYTGGAMKSYIWHKFDWRVVKMTFVQHDGFLRVMEMFSIVPFSTETG